MVWVLVLVLVQLAGQFPAAGPRDGPRASLGCPKRTSPALHMRPFMLLLCGVCAAFFVVALFRCCSVSLLLCFFFSSSLLLLFFMFCFSLLFCAYILSLPHSTLRCRALSTLYPYTAMNAMYTYYDLSTAPTPDSSPSLCSHLAFTHTYVSATTTTTKHTTNAQQVRSRDTGRRCGVDEDRRRGGCCFCSLLCSRSHNNRDYNSCDCQQHYCGITHNWQQQQCRQR